MIDKATIAKYDVQGPRYTSYPTAPEWSAQTDAGVYLAKLADLGRSTKSISLYVHIPFCEQLCYFCACMKVIRAREERHGDEYLAHLFKEVDLVVRALGRRCAVKQLHWGGGTPTFLSEEQIERLYRKLSENFLIDPQGEIAIEVDPRTVTPSKLAVLRKLGFNRISMGVQDFDPAVMESVNRQQPYALVRTVIEESRRLGFRSVNFDLIYGLPKQTKQTFEETMDRVVGLKPDRIALYNFAYVPWLQKHQSKLREGDFPGNDAKIDIFLLAREKLFSAGYQSIAMDHFALADDEMAQAFNRKKLYRNFMGYTVKPADEYLGLGVSAIGFLENTFVQNKKILADYYQALNEGHLAIERGKELSSDDIIRRWVILELMCHFQIDKNEFHEKFAVVFDQYFQPEQVHIRKCADDGLLKMEEDLLSVTELGQLFIRNVCMGFDAYFKQNDNKPRFSRTV